MKLFLLLLLSSVNVWAEGVVGIVGQWKTIDDATHQPKAIVEIFEKDGMYFGKITQLFRKPEEEQNPKCLKCTDSRKDQTVLGMQILEGLKKKSDTQWVDGDILDPENGTTYSCKVELIEDGKKLKVRGFVWVSLLGRTQVWEKN